MSWAPASFDGPFCDEPLGRKKLMMRLDGFQEQLAGRAISPEESDRVFDRMCTKLTRAGSGSSEPLGQSFEIFRMLDLKSREIHSFPHALAGAKVPFFLQT